MASKNCITFDCTPDQLKVAYKRAFGIMISVPTSGNSHLVVGLVNALLGAVEAKAADRDATDTNPSGGDMPFGSWRIIVFAKKAEDGQLLGNDVKRLQELLGLDAPSSDA
jgi:hypothetical protein